MDALSQAMWEADAESVKKERMFWVNQDDYDKAFREMRPAPTSMRYYALVMLNAKELAEESGWTDMQTKGHGLVGANSVEVAYALFVCLYQNRERNNRQKERRAVWHGWKKQLRRRGLYFGSVSDEKAWLDNFHALVISKATEEIANPEPSQEEAARRVRFEEDGQPLGMDQLQEPEAPQDEPLPQAPMEDNVEIPKREHQAILLRIHTHHGNPTLVKFLRRLRIGRVRTGS